MRAESSHNLKAGEREAPRMLTVGHSTLPIDEFIDLLGRHGVEKLVDIRSIPRSRHNPQFNTEALAKSLEQAGIRYTHLKELGGLRHPRPDSTNMGWRNASFRGYADYMQTGEFEQALDGLLRLCAGKRCAVMCAEAVPWRCHRSLVADALVARGIHVEHIFSTSKRESHHPTPFARIKNGKVVYPQPEGETRRKKAAGTQGELRFSESEESMARKKGKPKFTAAKEARRRARLTAGTPPGERVIPDKRRKPPKHKKPAEDPAEM